MKRTRFRYWRATTRSASTSPRNFVRRSRPRSFVLKQARPALERFPQYAAPTERLLFEARWFELARAHDPDAICPRVLALDEANRVLVLEDLSAAERLDRALARGAQVVRVGGDHHHLVGSALQQVNRAAIHARIGLVCVEQLDAEDGVPDQVAVSGYAHKLPQAAIR